MRRRRTRAQALDDLRQLGAGHGGFDGFVRDGDLAIGPWLNLGEVPNY
jgi:hypothetical protein